MNYEQEQQFAAEVKRYVTEHLPLSQISDSELQQQIEDIVEQRIGAGYCSIEQRVSIVEQVYSSIRGFGLLDSIIKDDTITEVMINGPENVFIEQNGRLFKLDKQFESQRKLEDIIQRIVGLAGREVNQANPICDTRLPDGSRVNVVLPPIALCGPTVTIRKFSKTPMTIAKLIEYGSLTQEIADKLQMLVEAKYKAGNTTEKTILFSANRFGSTYALSAATDQLNGSYVQTPQDVVVTETNPDALQNIRITLFKNNQTIILQEGTDYRIEVRGGNGQWYEYIYTVLAKNFADDGVYRLTFYSEDAAGNIAENTLDTKKQEIGFGVDKTKPNMVVTNLESDTTYPLENLTVSLSAGDNLLLQSVVVYLDDYSKAYKTWTAEEVAAIVADQGEFTFDIPGDSTGAHQVKIVCTDAAGNEQTEEITNFYVTTNLFVRYYNNKPLFFGSIAAVVVIAGVVIALAAGKKKKNDKEK